MNVGVQRSASVRAVCSLLQPRCTWATRSSCTSLWPSTSPPAVRVQGLKLLRAIAVAWLGFCAFGAFPIHSLLSAWDFLNVLASARLHVCSPVLICASRSAPVARAGGLLAPGLQLRPGARRAAVGCRRSRLNDRCVRFPLLAFHFVGQRHVFVLTRFLYQLRCDVINLTCYRCLFDLPVSFPARSRINVNVPSGGLAARALCRSRRLQTRRSGQ